MKILAFFLYLSLYLTLSPVMAKPLVPPDDPRQSITYWKPHTLNADQDDKVRLAHEVFSNLLRTWDDSRVEPGLFVVESETGPWAASLADGNILLSKSAIEVCIKLGQNRAGHLLAFILAHELAHQRVDDLWHHKFFRLAGSQSPQVQQRMLQGLDLQAKDMQDLERREAQADHDGLIIMATVGYDPQQVVAGKGFFTTWVESIWSDTCGRNNSSIPRQACEQAGNRAIRAQAQLRKVADQATLYELGIQQLVAGKFAGARVYLKAFGRDYPGRAVYSALGASYFIEALQIHQQITGSALWMQPALFYPVLLESLAPTKGASVSGKRASEKARYEALKRKRNSLLNHAIESYERAQHLAPDHPLSYFMAALAYLMDGNTFMARGMIQGKYLQRFGDDQSVQLLLAMISAMEGDTQGAYRQHQVLLEKADFTKSSRGLLSRNLFTYTASHNMAALLQQMKKSRQASAVWQQLAAQAKHSGNSMLFTLAVARIRPETANRPGKHKLAKQLLDPDRYLKKNAETQLNQSTVWLEGEELRLRSYKDGVRLVTDSSKRKVLAAWRPAGQPMMSSPLHIGDKIDRSLKVLGLPSRHLQMISGEYLAYDELGYAVHILNDKVVGWFMYPSLPGT